MEKEKIIVYIDEDLEELIPGFLDNRREDIASMRKSLAENDLDPIRILGHSMKGAGGGYGFDRITDIGSDIEEAAKAGDKETITRSIEELEDYVERVEVIFEESE